MVLYRKLIVPQKEPSPLLDRKIEELEAKFADMTDEELEDLGDDDGELGDQSLPMMQSSLSSEMDIMPYTPPQVRVCVITCVDLPCKLMSDYLACTISCKCFSCFWLPVHAKVHKGPFKEGGCKAEDQHERLHPVQQ